MFTFDTQVIVIFHPIVSLENEYLFLLIFDSIFEAEYWLTLYDFSFSPKEGWRIIYWIEVPIS